MTVAQLEKRIASLEKRITELEEQVEHERMMASVRRGLDDVKNGRVTPIDQVIREFRDKYSIPQQ